MDIVFWQNSLSIHQAPLIRALTKTMGKEVIVVTETAITKKRADMGWDGMDYGSATVIVAPSAKHRRSLVEDQRCATAHVFSGFGVYRETTASMRQLLRGGHNTVAIVSESWDGRGYAALGRFLRRKMAVLRFSRDIDLFLTIGRQAQDQFSSLGIPDSKIYPFSYFVEGADDLPEAPHRQGIFEMLFVGQLTERKDPATLIHALARVASNNWRLRIVGEGSLEVPLREISAQLGVTERVEFLPFQSNSAVRTIMQESDLLVLPSRYDGWGAVANEALHAGMKVALSESAGASQLVNSDSQGWTFPAGDMDSLTSILEEAIRSGPLTQVRRIQLREWADSSISPLAGACYLNELLYNQALNSERVRPPWKAFDA